jgi:hypothetical protein
MRRAPIVALSVLYPMALLAQERPTQVLLIVQERLKPNSMHAYDRNEREIARTSARLKSPHPYLALESVSEPKEVWWLNAFESEGHKDSVMQAYERNHELSVALRKLGRRKAALRYEPVSIVTTYKGELSDERPFSVSGARFFVVTVTNDVGKSGGSVFEAPDGRRFVLAPAARRQEADRKAAAAGAQARIFAIRPSWSFPADAWVAADPGFWRASPAAGAGAPPAQAPAPTSASGAAALALPPGISIALSSPGPTEASQATGRPCGARRRSACRPGIRRRGGQHGVRRGRRQGRVRGCAAA